MIVASWNGIPPERRLHALALLAWSDSMEGRSEMKQYDITVTETSVVVYFVQADNEEDARQALLQGEFDDYKTLSSEFDEILEIEEAPVPS
jgi:hypothetical protein